MFKLIKIYLGILCIAFILSSCSSNPDTYDSHGRPIFLKNYHGKWVIINYWAMWCKPCLTEIPTLNALYRQHKNKVMVLGVSFDQLTNQQIQRIAKKLDVTFPMLAYFPKEKFGIKNISTLPITFILTPDGKLYKTLKGPQTKKTLLRIIHNRKRQ